MVSLCGPAPAPTASRHWSLISGGEVIIIYGMALLPGGVCTQRLRSGAVPCGPAFQHIPAARSPALDNSSPSLLCRASLCEQSTVDSRGCSHSRRIPKMEQCTPGLGLSGSCSEQGPGRLRSGTASVAVRLAGISMGTWGGVGRGGHEKRGNRKHPNQPGSKPALPWPHDPCGEEAEMLGSSTLCWPSLCRH